MSFRSPGRSSLLHVCFAAFLAGCQGLTGNAADRVAFGLREGANRLGQSRNANDSITVRIPARTWPNGCPGAYKVQLLADSARTSGIVVSCLPKGATYASHSAKRFVRTPGFLEREFQAGQPADIMLQKRGKDLEISGFVQP
jgi:hypothetical protein